MALHQGCVSDLHRALDYIRINTLITYAYKH